MFKFLKWWCHEIQRVLMLVFSKDNVREPTSILLCLADFILAIITAFTPKLDMMLCVATFKKDE